MPDVTNEVAANETATPKVAKVKPQAKKVVKKIEKTKPAAKSAEKTGKGVKGKPAKAKKERSDRIPQEEITARVLKYLGKQNKPVKRAQIVAGTGLNEEHPINDTCNKVLGPNLVKREAAKFHDMGKGYVFTLTANGKKAAAKA